MKMRSDFTITRRSHIKLVAQTMNNKLVAAVLLVVAIMEGVAAFSTGPSSLTKRSASGAPFGPSLEFKTTSSTALSLKVKVDPNAKGKKSESANAKMAA
jgi:hypothetical protein